MGERFASHFLDLLALLAGDFPVESGEASGQGGEGVLVALAHGHAEQEVLEGDVSLALQRAGIGFVAFADANGINDDEMGLGVGIGAADGLQVGGREDAGAAAFHLLEIAAAADIAQEEEAFEWLDVGAGGDHVDRDGDAELGRRAELLDERLRLLVAHRLLVVGLVGDFLGEVVALAEDLADDVDDVLGVGVVLGKDEGLGNESATGEEFGEKGVLECLNDGADLRLDHDGAVEIAGFVNEVFVQTRPAGGAGFLAALIDVEAFLDHAASLGDIGFDPVDLVANIDAIGHGALVVVLHDEVLVEKADGLLRGRGGEADDEGVEVFEDLPPEAVDGAVTFVGDDEIEGLDRDGGIVGNLLHATIGGIDFVGRDFVGILGKLLAAQHGVKPLDSADSDAGDGIELVGGEMLNVVEFGELAAGIGRDELLELGGGLTTEIGSIHEEENTASPRILDEPIGEGTGGVGLARARGHLDEGAGFGFCKRFLKTCDGFDLALAHPGGGEGMREGHLGQPVAQGSRLGQPLGQCLGSMKTEHATGTRLRIAFIAEERFDASRFVIERKPVGGLEEIGKVLAIMGGLVSHGGERHADFLGFNHANGLAIHQQQVIAAARFQGNFAKSDAAGGAKVNVFVILDDPA